MENQYPLTWIEGNYKTKKKLKMKERELGEGSWAFEVEVPGLTGKGGNPEHSPCSHQYWNPGPGVAGAGLEVAPSWELDPTCGKQRVPMRQLRIPQGQWRRKIPGAADKSWSIEINKQIN